MNKYVITNTDNNLGIVVSEQTWLIEKCLELLNDNNNYIFIDPLCYMLEIWTENIIHFRTPNWSYDLIN